MFFEIINFILHSEITTKLFKVYSYKKLGGPNPEISKFWANP